MLPKCWSGDQPWKGHQCQQIKPINGIELFWVRFQGLLGGYAQKRRES
jgi:hypothetical protein